MVLVLACSAPASQATDPHDGVTDAPASASATESSGGLASSGAAASEGSVESSATETGAAPPKPEGMYVDEARAALTSAIHFFVDHLSRHGGYVWTHAVDLQGRWGEGTATDDQIWVQPPGTPAVGLSMLAAYEQTGDAASLGAAVAAGDALLYGQLRSGGWDKSIDFDPAGELVAQYRNGMGGGKNNSSLDDNTTQSVLCFLVRLDEQTGFADPVLAEAIDYGFDALLGAQFPGGLFPAIWDGEGLEDVANTAASIPDPYPSQPPAGNDYWDFPTLNDNLAGDVARALLCAHDTYGDPRYATAVTALAQGLLLAQLPGAQPAWAQQYNAQMEPNWARVFEPPAVTGWESQDAMETLLAAYRLDADQRYLDGATRALDYLRAKVLPDGQLARFYELGTDLPLYFTSDYALTYDDSDLPGHYGFKMPSRLDAIAEQLQDPSAPPTPQDFDALESAARSIIDALDGQGRWVDVDVKVASGIPQGDYILSSTFVDNVAVLAEYLRRAAP